MKVFDYKQNIKHLSKSINNLLNNKVKSINNNTAKLSLLEYNSWQETAYLLKSKKNANRLRQSIKDVKAGIFQTKKLIKL